MTMPARPIAFFADFTRMRTLRWIFAATVLAAVATPGNAGAATRPGAYDGTWNVTFTPQAGNCHASNTVPFVVFGTRVASGRGGEARGGANRNGSVAVRIIVGASWANGSGGRAGTGGCARSAGLISRDRCSGVWQAMRN